jgi:tetratricopeptide (TPR) repeat protein
MAMRQLTFLILTSILLASPPAANAQQPRDAAQKQLEYAMGLYKLGIYYEAALEFRRFTKDYPDNNNAGAAAYYRARSLYEFGTSPAVREAARKAVAVFHHDYPNHPARNLGFFLLGEIAMEEALEFERAIGVAKRNNQPTATLQNRFEAACREAYPNYEEFIELTNLRALEQDPRAKEEMAGRVVTARYNIAQCLIALAKFEDAIKQYRLLLEPQFAEYGPEEAQFLIGQAYYEWGKRLGPDGKREKLDLAMRAYKDVMFYGLRGRTEFSDDARLGQAWCLYELRKFSDCRKLLETNRTFFQQVYDQFKDNPNRIEQRWVRSLWPDVYYLYAKCYFDEGQYDDARKYFEIVMNMQGSDNIWRAEATRMFDECRKLIERQLKLATEKDAANAYKVAVNKYLTGHREDAVADFERIWLGYKDVRTWAYRDLLLYYWGKSLYWCGDDGRLFEAAAVFNYLSKTGNPQTAVQDDRNRTVRAVGEAAYSEGLCYWRLSKEMEPGKEQDAIIAAAIQAFERLATISPEHPETPETLLNVGNFYLNNKEFRKAGLAYRQMVTAYPQHENAPKALLNLCYVYRELNQLDDVIWAASFFEEKFPRRPDVVQAIDLKGAAWFRQARNADDPDTEKEYYGKAAAEYGKLKPDAFSWLSDVEREQEYGTLFANALFYAGYSYSKVGETDKAIDYYRDFIQTAAEDNSHLAEGRTFLGDIYLEQGEPAKAVDVLRPLADALDEPDEKAAQGVATLVEALLKLAADEGDAAKKKLTDEAAARAERVYTVFAGTPIRYEPFVTLADAFRQAGLNGEMIKAYTELRTNQRLGLRRQGVSGADRRKLYNTYTRLLFVAGQACSEVADELAARGADTKQLDVAAGDFLDEHLDRAKKLLGPGKIPANYVDVYFQIAKIFKRAKEPEKGAKALEKIIAVVEETDPRFLKAYFERGNVWLECGEPKRALASYLYVINWADPDNPARPKYVALSYYQAGVAQYQVTDDDQAAAKAKRLFDTLIKTFEGTKDQEIQELLTKARGQLAKIEKLQGAPGGP